MRRLVKILVILLAAAFLSIWGGLGLLFHRGLSYWPEPERPAPAPHSPVVARALWVGVGETGEIAFTRRGALGTVVGMAGVFWRASRIEGDHVDRFRPDPGWIAAQTCLKIQYVQVSPSAGRYHLGNLSRTSWMSRNWTADEIVDCLAERLFFGKGLYGIEAAAQHYFSVSADELSEEQAALLGAIVQAPSRYDPERHPERAIARRDVVLRLMRAIPSQ